MIFGSMRQKYSISERRVQLAILRVVQGRKKMQHKVSECAKIKQNGHLVLLLVSSLLKKIKIFITPKMLNKDPGGNRENNCSEILLE